MSTVDNKKLKELKEQLNIQKKTIDRYCMMVVSKYFETIKDYINMEKSCKEYRGIMEQFKFNPIPFKNKKERELFNNIQTYHYYKESEINKKIEKDSKIAQFIHWETIIHPKLIEKKEKHIYKNVEEVKVIDKGKCGDDVEFEVYEDGVMVIEGKGDMKNYDNMGAPWNLEDIVEVIIGDGVSSIGDYSFCGYNYYEKRGITSYSFSNLEQITIPTSVSSIGKACFANCYDLKVINIPTSVQSLGDYCFYKYHHFCNIDVPTSVTFLGKCCFGGGHEEYEEEIRRIIDEKIHR